MKILKNVLCLILISFSLNATAQELVKAKMTARMVPSEKGNTKLVFAINCTFKKDSLLTQKADLIESKDNWKIIGAQGQYLIIEKIEWQNELIPDFNIYGNWSDEDVLSVIYSGDRAKVDQKIKVTKDTNWSKTKWGFGKGKSIDLSARRIAEQKAIYAFDYDANIKIVERYLFSNVSRDIWIYSINLNLKSKGTFGKDDNVQNGTQTSADLQLSPVIFAAGLIYDEDVSAGFQIETRMDPTNGKLLELTNKSFKFSGRFEIPYSNYPFFYIHRRSNYLRHAMPLTVNVDYLPKGKNDSGQTTLSRVDFRLTYEMAFSPFLILKSEWGQSNFFEAPQGMDNRAHYYTVTIAQDLTATKSILGFLGFILGSDESLKDKYFIYFRLTQGRKPPSFQDTNEKSFGLSMYL